MRGAKQRSFAERGTVLRTRQAAMAVNAAVGAVVALMAGGEEHDEFAAVERAAEAQKRTWTSSSPPTA